MSAPLEQTLLRFGEQFSWEPLVENSENLSEHKSFVLAGMGGSHLGAWLIRKFSSAIDLTIHRNYGLPPLSKEKERDSLFIASSYSGTTEETLDAMRMAMSAGMSVSAVSLGGDLLSLAREKKAPLVALPDTGLEPRMAIGYATLAIARLMGDSALESAIREGGKSVNPKADMNAGLALGQKLIGKIPVIWASSKNLPLAYIWKVKFNETSKIPAFCNAFPELNHNEFTGFDVFDSTRPVAQNIHVIMLEDAEDHPRIQKRMEISAAMLSDRKISVDRVRLSGDGFQKLFRSALFGDWASLSLAQHYGVPNPETPLIAEFKKKMADA